MRWSWTLPAPTGRAMQLSPLCYEIRAKYLHALTPRWGGSYERMKRFVGSLSAQTSANPKLRVLAGFAQNDLCETLRESGKLVEAAAACDRALQFGDDPRLLESKLWLLLKQERYQDMLPLADRALTLSPQYPDALRLRFHARLKSDNQVGAAEDLLTVRQLRPSDTWIAEQTDWMVRWLRANGDRLRKAGDNDTAAQRYELALKREEAMADLKRACDLHMQRACDGLRRMRAEAR
jgi:tetratricopeptide (TPR) repeat protein